MRKYSNLTLWQNIGRRKQLEKYQSQVERYFELIDYNYLDRTIIDNEESRKIRKDLSKQSEVVQVCIIETGLSPYVVYTPPPAIGGYVQRINLIENLFKLQNYDIETQAVIDIIDQALGVYEGDFVKSIIRVFNPIFWLGKVLEFISSLPFQLLGQIGFNQQKLEVSFIGKLIKFIIKIATLFALVWELLARLKIFPDTFNLVEWIEKLKI